eukprot:m.69047 g.69047  ORF g.69047 m.69047 type:complete len:434 (+) comp24039_c1_seq1:129-1430(+)
MSMGVSCSKSRSPHHTDSTTLIPSRKTKGPEETPLSAQHRRKRLRITSVIPETWSTNIVADAERRVDETRVPIPRSGHIAVVREDSMYVYGGYAPNPDRVFPELWRYHMLSETWELVPTSGFAPLTACSQSTIMVDRDTMFVFGGTGIPFGERNSREIHKYDFWEKRWSVVKTATITAPCARFGQAMVMDKSKKSIWLYGGTSGTVFYSDVWCFNLQSLEWKCVAPLTTNNVPKPRYKHDMVMADDNLIIIGGGWPFPNNNTVLDEVYMFNTTTLTWTTRACVAEDPTVGFPVARRSHTCVLEGTYIYMIGGTAFYPIASERVWRLDINTMTWKQVDSRWMMPSFFHSCAVSPDGVCVTFGGVGSTSTDNCLADNQQAERHNEVCMFTPLQIPSLLEISMQALASQRPLPSEKTLVRCGVPPCLIRRIYAPEL